MRRLGIAASALVVAAFVAAALALVAYPGFVDHAEPSVATTSWLLLRGVPLHHRFDSPDRYALLYGPTAYLANAAAMAIAGGTMRVLRALVFVVDVAMLFFSWRAYRRVAGAAGALVTTALVLLFLHVPLPNHYLVQVRGDVFLVAAIAAGLWAATSDAAWAGGVLAIAAAFAIDVKASGFVYCAPLLVRFAARRGLRAGIVVAIGAAVASALPFAIPNVSLPAYAAWVEAAAHHPRSAHDLLTSLRTLAVFALVPLAIVGLRPWRSPAVMAWARDERAPLAALAASIAVVVALSAKLGAGAHHLLPFVPLLGYECAALVARAGLPWGHARPIAFGAVAAGVVALAAWRAAGGIAATAWWVRHDWPDAAAARAEVLAVAAQHRGARVEMGYGATEDARAFQRLPLVVATGHLMLDEEALDDMQLAGIEVPPSTVDELASCSVAAWLVPRGQAPFSLLNYYNHLAPALVGPRPLFSDAFRDAFARSYRKTASTLHYDVWTCAAPEPPARVAAGPPSSR